MTEQELWERAYKSSQILAALTENASFAKPTDAEVSDGLRESQIAMCAIQSIECYRRTGKFPEGA